MEILDQCTIIRAQRKSLKNVRDFPPIIQLFFPHLQQTSNAAPAGVGGTSQAIFIKGQDLWFAV